MTALRSQMNSHLISNTVGSIQHYILQNEVKQFYNVKIPGRIQEAIELKESALKYKSLLTNLKTQEQDKKILIPSKKKLEHIFLKDIVFLQVENNYTSIYIKNQNRIVVSKTLKDYEDILCEEEDSFFCTNSQNIYCKCKACEIH